MAITVRIAAAFSGRHKNARKPGTEPGQHRLDVVIARIEIENPLSLRFALLVDDGLEQLLLVSEIHIERALGDPGSAGDVVHAGRIESLGQKHRPGAIDNLAPLGAVLIPRRRPYLLQNPHFAHIQGPLARRRPGIGP